MRLLDSLDKIILFVAGLFLFVPGFDNAAEIATILVATTALGLITYFDHAGPRAVIGIVYSILILSVPTLSLFQPVVLYGVHEKRLSPWTILLLLPAAFFGTEPVFIVILGLIALWLKERTELYAKQKTDYQALHDSKRELEQTAKRQNQILLEKQDGELHLATLDERNRIAREIHDHVGHQLSSALLQVGALLVTDPGNQSLLTLKKTLNLAMDNIRKSVHNLFEDSIQLKDQIQKLVDAFTLCDIHLNASLEDVPETPVKYALIAVVKEALSNVIKHSNATRVEIALIEHPGFYQLIVSDNGNPNPASGDEGIGLKNIQHRIESLEGHFRVRRDRGFELFITVPKNQKKE
ncbi:MAG: hypothetical protein AVO33_05980 [delta proteobacterium ML8_F1]|nr:MAG: hypothetical protein AVO33_05980 [delta proteobacterium ML8_F1]